VSRFSAKRMLVVIAGLALSLALGITALRMSDARLARLVGPRAIEWAVPLVVGGLVGLTGWMLLDGTTPTGSEARYAETTCPACGRAVLQDWRLCPHCGAFLVAGPTSPSEAHEQRV
jgi:hypothetical protein